MSSWPSLPVLALPSLYHVGTMNPADKGRDGVSLEGHGLSVSTCPWAWERICKLGADPWWKLSGAPARLLDVHSLDSHLRELVGAWATKAGLLARAARWRTESEDESGELRYQLWDSPGCAEAESEDGSIREVQVLVAADQLHVRMGFRVCDVVAPDLALVCWCEDETDLDGLWWADILDEHALSAPRGVILPRSLGTFVVETVPGLMRGMQRIWTRRWWPTHRLAFKWRSHAGRTRVPFASLVAIVPPHE